MTKRTRKRPLVDLAAVRGGSTNPPEVVDAGLYVPEAMSLRVQPTRVELT